MYVQAILQTLVCVAVLYAVFGAAACLTLHIVAPGRRLYGPTLCGELVGAPLVWLAACLLPGRWLWAAALVRLVWAVPLFGIYVLMRRAPLKTHTVAAVAVGGMTAAVGLMLYGVTSLL